MHPILLDLHVDIPLLGPLNFPAYFTMLTLSFGLGMWMTWREAPRLGMDRERVLDLCLWGVVWAIIGSRVLHIIADGHFMEYVHLCTDPMSVAATEAKVAVCNTSQECGFEYVCNLATHTCHPPRDCLRMVKVWQGGMAFYGGFVFGAAFGLCYAHKHALGMWKMADLAAPWIAFGLALTRMGCFLGGCCFGKVCDLPWGAHFPRHSTVWRAQLDAHLITNKAAALPVHPTQLYLAALNLLTFVVLYRIIRPRKRFDGQIFLWLLIMKGVFRSFVEIFRDDERGVFFGGLASTSQLISIPLVAAGVVLLVKMGRRARATAGT